MRDYCKSLVGKHFWVSTAFYHLTFGFGLQVNACTLWRACMVTVTLYVGPFQVSTGWHR